MSRVVIQGVALEESEIRAMQKEFPHGTVAGIIDRILRKSIEPWLDRLQSLGASMDTIRQAQGANYLVDEVDGTIRDIIQFDLEKFNDVVEEQEREAAEEANEEMKEEGDARYD